MLPKNFWNMSAGVKEKKLVFLTFEHCNLVASKSQFFKSIVVAGLYEKAQQCGVPGGGEGV